MVGMRDALGDYTRDATVRQPLRMLDRQAAADDYKKESTIIGITEERQKVNERGGR
jgi:hypothetical protein